MKALIPRRDPRLLPPVLEFFRDACRRIKSASELPMTHDAVSVVCRASDEAIRLGDGSGP
jgi:hypothetical protein